MTACPCDVPPKRVLRIAAGLSALTRQTQAFPEVRLALLEEVSRKAALAGWRARGERDFGVMWLEMWAYVSDVLGFYDERIANESYIRTAVRRSSLRRIIELLGYVPAPGVAGSATLAAFAEGRKNVPVAASTAFRSDAFENQPPQVFETASDTSVHPLTNTWQIGPVAASVLSGDTNQSELIFETANLGVAKNRILLVRRLDANATHPLQATKVTSVAPFQGKDQKTYVRVQINPPISLPTTFGLDDVQVQIPTVVAVPTRNGTGAVSTDRMTIRLDSIYRQLKVNDVVIVPDTTGPNFFARTATTVKEILVDISEESDVQSPVTQVTLDDVVAAKGLDPRALSFHFNFVEAGRLTAVAETEPSQSALRSADGVAVVGLVERPPAAVNGVLERDFLLRDADNQGARVHGTMTFADDGTARFRATGSEPLPSTLKTPIAVFGNLLEVSRGETVFNEILGSGDSRAAGQTFKLKKKPLTYVFDPSVPGTSARSTLQVRVDGLLWQEVRSFFGRGPQDRVYIVRPDDDGNSFLTFGDGVRGQRLPSGVKNVRATYRFGSGEAAPPAGAIRQLARAVKGLRRVESPIAAVIGKDPDPPETLRTAAPRSVLLFGRAVSTLDFEALASLSPGVIKANAEFLWIPDEQEAGVVVTYIGSAIPAHVLTALKAEADPGLPIVAQRAVARVASFQVEVQVDPQFDEDVVAEQVRLALVDDQTGPLAPRNAPIGQQLFRSLIFDVIHAVPGVVAIASARIQWVAQSAALATFRRARRPPRALSADFKNSATLGVCAGAGAFLDFSGANAVQVSGSTATTPVLGQAAKGAV